MVEPQNQAQAGGKSAEANDDVPPAGESHKQNELGARGVPLVKKEPLNEQVDEESHLDERNDKQHKEINVQVRLEKEQLEKEAKEKIAREQELEKAKINKEMQAKLEQERLERERKELVKEEELVKQRAEREVQARMEKERLERREPLERDQQEIQHTDNEIQERAKNEAEEEEAREKLAQLERVKNDREAAQGAEMEDDGALKKGGRDLKEKVAAQADPRVGVEDGALRAHPQGSQEKVRDQGGMDLRRKRRAVGPRAAEGPPETTGGSRGVPGLEPLLELGGSDLHAALEEQLLAGAMVHSRQIKEASEDQGEQ